MKFKNNTYCILLLSLLTLGATAQEGGGESEKVDETQVIASGPEEAAPTPANTPANIPVPERLSQEKKALLYNALTTPTPIWLNGDEQTILSFWQSDLSGQPVGAVLLLHNEGDTPLSPQTFLNYHQHLPLDGWATLSIELPHTPNTAPPKRPKIVSPPATEQPTDQDANDDNSEGVEEANVDETKVIFDDSADGSKKVTKAASPPATVNTEEEPSPKASPEDIKQQAMERIQQGVDYLQKQGQYNIVILGDGVGALRALQYIQMGEAQTGKVSGIVLSNVRNTYGGHTDKPLDLLNYKNIPTLDIYSNINSQNQKEAHTRKVWAKKNKMSIYRQKRLTAPIDLPSATTETHLTKTVRGFLNRFATGTKL